MSKANYSPMSPDDNPLMIIPMFFFMCLLLVVADGIIEGILWPIRYYLFSAVCYGVIIYTISKVSNTVLRKKHEAERQKEWGNAPSLSVAQMTRCLFLILAINGIAYLHGWSDYIIGTSGVISVILIFYIFFASQ
jgi:O-antigen/teichoic acid export membrane protein